ncbi:MAG: DUF4834 domain-containing protein [Bacteroidetes bacterium]|nr:DUF4834 domain-containing protein [Bacteroidota bacterium]
MLEFILWLILIYLIFRFIAKFVLPYLLKYYLNKFQQKFYQQSSHDNTTRKEGDTSIDFIPDTKTKKSTSAEKIGEYVDYEEVESK